MCQKTPHRAQRHFGTNTFEAEEVLPLQAKCLVTRVRGRHDGVIGEVTLQLKCKLATRPPSFSHPLRDPAGKSLVMLDRLWYPWLTSISGT